MTRKTVIIFVVLLTFVCLNNYVKATENEEENKDFFKDLGKIIQDLDSKRPYPLVAIKEELSKLFGRRREINNTEEHGRLDSIGRDVLRKLKSDFDDYYNKVLKKVFKEVETPLETIAETDDLDRDIITIVMEQFHNLIQGIVPGTKWCGEGDIAKNETDFGVFSATDRCCQQLDYCNLIIFSGESKYGLKNNGLFTRTSCSCGRKFYECLKITNSIISNKIGFTYFNVLGPQCIQNVDCERKECYADEEVANGSTYKWVDSPIY